MENNFNKNKVFEDYEFNYSPLNIEKTLSKFGSFLLTYQIVDTPVITWIDNVCQTFNVNPRLILSLLEQYHKLITSTEPPAKEILDYALDMGIGSVDSFGFTQNLKLATTFMGLDKQIYHCVKNHRRWFDLAGAKVNTRINCVDDEVNPQNAFTYALYMCDPFVGMKNLYRVSVMKDSNNEAIEEEIKISRPKNIFKYLLSFISKRFMDETKVLKRDTNLMKEAPFGVYQTWNVWGQLFK